MVRDSLQNASTSALDLNLKLPDIWQQTALRHLREGRDVIIDAPTGAGKTYVFELLVEEGLPGKAIYTVPTRALANDKLREWRTARWNVGIATGDISENTQAPVVVATLETQKSRLLRHEGPDLLVIDEYQMLADPVRGVNYELAIALAPQHTQLLLLSGSVANPEKIVQWMRKIGRNPVLVSHKERPIPLDQVFMENLPDRLPARVFGFWPRMIGRALAAAYGPILMFAPRRREAEDLARQLSSALPVTDQLELSKEQRQLAGSKLARLLRNRIAFHHSGLSYAIRAGLIEPLAKAGHLRIVVATTGLSSGINFSMRSVVVTDLEYRNNRGHEKIRPDELLQMFGRAGRRGLDDRGYVLVAPAKPGLGEARPLILKRTNQVDWPSLIAVLGQAEREGIGPYQATTTLTRRLFSEQQVPLGIRQFLREQHRWPILRDQSGNKTTNPNLTARNTLIEILASNDQWERRRGPQRRPLEKILMRRGENWVPALSSPKVLEGIRWGTPCILEKGKFKIYGREIPLASFPEEEGLDTLRVNKRLRAAYRDTYPKNNPLPRFLTLEEIEMNLVPKLPAILAGGKIIKLKERNDQLFGIVDYRSAEIYALVDSQGTALWEPPQRERLIAFSKGWQTVGEEAPAPETARTPAEIWYQLGLIKENGTPTRRGELFSLFNHGEGLAVAAGLEDETYPVEDLIWDIANLRAGHRFNGIASGSNRLTFLCQEAFHGRSFMGYLNKGLPSDYGDGASEVLRQTLTADKKRDHFINEELNNGDIERAYLEWRSLLNHIRNATDLRWDRWMDLKSVAETLAQRFVASHSILNLPELTVSQKNRYIPLENTVHFQDLEALH